MTAIGNAREAGLFGSGMPPTEPEASRSIDLEVISAAFEPWMIELIGAPLVSPALIVTPPETFVTAARQYDVAGGLNVDAAGIRADEIDRDRVVGLERTCGDLRISLGELVEILDVFGDAERPPVARRMRAGRHKIGGGQIVVGRSNERRPIERGVRYRHRGRVGDDQPIGAVDAERRPCPWPPASCRL